jgi:hypothetical protein
LLAWRFFQQLILSGIPGTVASKSNLLLERACCAKEMRWLLRNFAKYLCS